MTENVHHQTRKSADMDLAKKAISPEIHAAIMEGRLSLAEARDLGRNAGPDGPAVRADKDDRSRECLCGCGETTSGGRFRMGHDQRMVAQAKEYVRGQHELTEEQVEYVTESGKLQQARARVVEEDHRAAIQEDRRRERDAAKAEKQSNASE